MLDLQPANNDDWLKAIWEYQVESVDAYRVPLWWSHGMAALHQLEVKVEPCAYALISILDCFSIAVDLVGKFPYIYVIPMILGS